MESREKGGGRKVGSRMSGRGWLSLGGRGERGEKPPEDRRPDAEGSRAKRRGNAITGGGQTITRMRNVAYGAVHRGSRGAEIELAADRRRLETLPRGWEASLANVSSVICLYRKVASASYVDVLIKFVNNSDN